MAIFAGGFLAPSARKILVAVTSSVLTNALASRLVATWQIHLVDRIVIACAKLAIRSTVTAPALARGFLPRGLAAYATSHALVEACLDVASCTAPAGDTPAPIGTARTMTRANNTSTAFDTSCGAAIITNPGRLILERGLVCA